MALLACLLTALILTVQAASQSLTINLITPDLFFVNMYSNGQYNSSFVQQNAPFNCSMSQIYTYLQNSGQNQANTPYTIQFGNLPLNISFTLKSIYNNKFTPSLSTSWCSNINGNTCNITVKNNCPSDISQLNYFTIMQLQVQGFPIPFSYYVLCNDSFYINTFEWGLVVMMVFCLALIILTVIYSKAWSMGGAGIKINYWIVITFWICIIVAAILAQTTDVLGPILQVCILLAGIAGMWVCSNEIIFLLKINLLQKGIQFKEIFKIRILDLISLFIGIGTVIAYYFSNKNWIVNNIICISIIIASIKILKFTNLKIAIFTLVVGLAVQMAIVEYIHFGKGTSYNYLILDFFNYPFELQLPTINPVYKQKCAWLPFTAIISPGIFMSYLKRFDISRNTNIYFLTAIASFVFGAVVWMLISVRSTHSWPLEIVTGPITLGLVAIFAYKRREIRTLWQGSFYDEDFANRDGLLDIMDVINQESSPKQLGNKEDIQLIRASVLDELQLKKREDSDMSIFQKLSVSSNQKEGQFSISKPNVPQ